MNANSLSLTSAGIGLTNGTFTGVEFTSLTGVGSSVVATFTIGSGLVDAIQVTSAGSGYAVGDLLLANPIGATGSGVRVTVGIVSTTNLLIVDDVDSNISAGVAYTYFNSAGVGANMTAPTAVTNDAIRDGVTVMLFDHHNHGMHASTNKLRVYDVQSDVKPTTLAAAVDNDTTIIKVADGSAFTTFEGSPVGAANTGYLLINKEIISYNTISSNDITVASRVVGF